MPRPREFALDDALEQAMIAFWRGGYRATSVRDLCEAMEIGAGSFYATFGSKAELFRLSLRRYLGLRAKDAIGPPGHGALRAYFDAVISDRMPQGCLLVSAASERDALEPDAQRLVDDGLRGLEDFFWACLGGRANARKDARLLAAIAAGLQVMHRAHAPREDLREIVDRVLGMLDIEAG